MRPIKIKPSYFQQLVDFLVVALYFFYRLKSSKTKGTFF